MTNEELYKKIESKFENIDNRFDSLENKFDNLENRFGDMKNSFENKFEEIDNKIGEVNTNVKKINEKLDMVTNSNIAQILTNQMRFQNEINGKIRYDELEHKKFDCRISELELQKNYIM